MLSDALTNKRKIVFVSSRQDELQGERDSLRDFINTQDEALRCLFAAKTFESDLSGRRESVDEMTKDGVLRSDVYLGIFDREYSQPTVDEYEIARNDRLVRKEILICIRERDSDERENLLREFLSRLMHAQTGHSCIVFHDSQDLVSKVKESLLSFWYRKAEGFLLSECSLGPNLDLARSTSLPEALRRGLLQPVGRIMVPKGRRGVPEYYRLDENGDKIDVTWDYVQHEVHVSEDIRDFYKKRYLRPF